MSRITYAAKTGHYFSAIGKLLIERGEIDAARTVSMQSIRQWLADHPDEADEVLWHNRSFIFFREAAVDDPALGRWQRPRCALEPGRSLAVDRLIHTFGVPFFIVSDSLTHLDGGRPFRRLMLALDTGSAIVGPARGDIFTGSGDEAGRLAGIGAQRRGLFHFHSEGRGGKVRPWPGIKKLTQEDRILWGKVARTTRPLPGRMDELDRNRRAFAGPREAAFGARDQGRQVAGRSIRRVAAASRQSARSLASSAGKTGQAQARARVICRSRRGSICTAWSRAKRTASSLHFLLRAHDRGLRHVLVITGKGTSLGSDGASEAGSADCGFRCRNSVR